MTETEDQATLHFARAIVADERQEELPLFDVQASVLLQRVRKGTRASKSYDSLLGIGDESAAIALITPIAMVFAEATFGVLRDAARDVTKDLMKKLILGWIDWLAGKSKRPPEALPEEIKYRLRHNLTKEMEVRFPGTKTDEFVETVLRKTFEGHGRGCR